jgi:hypothetical protein
MLINICVQRYWVAHEQGEAGSAYALRERLQKYRRTLREIDPTAIDKNGILTETTDYKKILKSILQRGTLPIVFLSITLLTILANYFLIKDFPIEMWTWIKAIIAVSAVTCLLPYAVSYEFIISREEKVSHNRNKEFSNAFSIGMSAFPIAAILMNPFPGIFSSDLISIRFLYFFLASWAIQAAGFLFILIKILNILEKRIKCPSNLLCGSWSVRLMSAKLLPEGNPNSLMQFRERLHSIYYCRRCKKNFEVIGPEEWINYAGDGSRLDMPKSSGSNHQ